MTKSVNLIIYSIICLIFGAVMILNNKAVVEGIIRAIEVCLRVIIPSMFGYMILANFIIKSGLYRVVFKPLWWLFRGVTAFSEDEFSIFVLSLFGGYPIGAMLLPKGSRVLPYCYCASPVFVLNIVGSANFGAVYLTNVAVLIVLAMFYKPVKVTSACASVANGNGNAIISAVTASGRALFTVCIMIVAFAILTETVAYMGVNDPLLFAVLEVSNLTRVTASPAVFAAVLSFGGVCVLGQVIALGSLSGRELVRFVVFRVFASVLSFAVVMLAELLIK